MRSCLAASPARRPLVRAPAEARDAGGSRLTWPSGQDEPTPSDWSCRQALECSRDSFEGEWQLCFDECLAPLTAAEWLALFDLFECVVPLCSAMPQCMPDDGTCTACYLANLLAVEPNLPAECAAQILACT